MTTPDQDMDIRAGLMAPVRRNCWTCRHDAKGSAGAHHCSAGGQNEPAPVPVREWVEGTEMDTACMPSKDADGCPGYQPTETGAHLRQHGPSTGDGPTVRDSLPDMPAHIRAAVLDRLNVGEVKYSAALRVGWADGPTAQYQEDLDGITYGVVIGIPPAEMTARVALAVRSELRVRGIDPDGPGGHPCPLAQPVAIDPSPSARSPDGGYWPPDL